MHRTWVLSMAASLHSLTALAVALPTSSITVFKALPTFVTYPPILPRADDDQSPDRLLLCGGSFPSKFRCTADTTCMQLNTTVSNAVICCPHNVDCSVIAPITCERGAQDAVAMPANMIHSEPTVELETCGANCCPMGYECQGNNCYAVQSAASSSSTSSEPSTASMASITVSAPTSTYSEQSTSSGAAAAAVAEITEGTDTDPLAAGTTRDDGKGFSGRSFAAGFLPGIFIGGILIALLLYFCFFRKRSQRLYAKGDEEKWRSSNDQLTSLGPSPALGYRPTMHGRSISEPVADMAGTHRTDFARSTPPRLQPFDEQAENLHALGNTCVITSISGEKAAATPRSRLSRLSTKSRLSSKLWSPDAMPWKSPNFKYGPSTPIPAQPPLPNHLKRGTVSVDPLFLFKKSGVSSQKSRAQRNPTPIRGLENKGSDHSLHRRMNEDAGPGSADNSAPSSVLRYSKTGRVMWPMRPNYGKTQSQEEIMIGVDNSYSSPDQSRQLPSKRTRPRAVSETSSASSAFEDVSPASPTFLGSSAYTALPETGPKHISNCASVYPYPNDDSDTPTRQPLHPAQHTTTLPTVTPPTVVAHPARPGNPTPMAAVHPSLGSPYTPSKHTQAGITATANNHTNNTGTYLDYRPHRQTSLVRPPSSPTDNPNFGAYVHDPNGLSIPREPTGGEGSMNDSRFTTFGDIMQRAGVEAQDLVIQPPVPAVTSGSGGLSRKFSRAGSRSGGGGIGKAGMGSRRGK